MKLRAVILALAVLCLGSPAFAQGERDRVVVLREAPIVVIPDASRQPLRVAAVGTSLVLVAEEPVGWIQVQFQDPQFGLRTGYVQSGFVRVEKASLRPMDLSVPKVVDVAASNSRAAISETPQTARPAAASPRPGAPAPFKARLDFGLMNAFPLSSYQVITSTTSSVTAQAIAYPELPHAWGFDSGVMFGAGQVNIGVRWTWLEYTGSVGVGSALAVSNGILTFGGTTAFKRTEHVFDVPIGYTFERKQLSVSAFGGPTLFYLKHDFTTRGTAVSGLGFGGNGGGEIAWFPSRHVGVGGGARFNLGRVTLENPNNATIDDHFTVGTVTLTVGPRFRF